MIVWRSVSCVGSSAFGGLLQFGIGKKSISLALHGSGVPLRLRANPDKVKVLGFLAVRDF